MQDPGDCMDTDLALQTQAFGSLLFRPRMLTNDVSRLLGD